MIIALVTASHPDDMRVYGPFENWGDAQAFAAAKRADGHSVRLCEADDPAPYMEGRKGRTLG